MSTRPNIANIRQYQKNRMLNSLVQKLINTHFAEKLEIIAFCPSEPSLELTQKWSPEPRFRLAYQRELRRLQTTGKPNEPHALVVSHNYKPNQDIHLQLETLDFASICALREQNHLPAVLSASAILVCSETEELILHQRSKEVATHPDHLHIFGGAFNPDADLVSGLPKLGATILRELWEETSQQLHLPDASPRLLTKEKTSGFLQFCVLGVPVKASQLQHFQGNWEGDIRRVAFADLPEVLSEPNWVPSGKAHVLSWLALGAAQTAPGQQFSGYTPGQLFEFILGQPRHASDDALT